MSIFSFCLQDSSVLAQLGWPDMRLPIAYTITWPERLYCSEVTWPRLDLCKYVFHEVVIVKLLFFYVLKWPHDHLHPIWWCRLGSLTFKTPDNVKYPSMDLAYAAGRAGGTMTGVLSAANEKAVEMFIDEKYVFNSIPHILHWHYITTQCYVQNRTTRIPRIILSFICLQNQLLGYF